MFVTVTKLNDGKQALLTHLSTLFLIVSSSPVSLLLPGRLSSRVLHLAGTLALRLGVVIVMAVEGMGVG